MAQDSGLAFYEPQEADERPDLFFAAPSDYPQIETWRRLNPASFFVALRINKEIPRAFVKTLKVKVKNPANGRSLIASVVDRGPGVLTRDVDISEGASRYLGVVTYDLLEILIDPETFCNWRPN